VLLKVNYELVSLKSDFKATNWSEEPTFSWWFEYSFYFFVKDYVSRNL